MLKNRDTGLQGKPDDVIVSLSAQIPGNRVSMLDRKKRIMMAAFFFPGRQLSGHGIFDQIRRNHSAEKKTGHKGDNDQPMAM